jgi:hypothetical protein
VHLDLESDVTWTRPVSSLRETGRALASETFPCLCSQTQTEASIPRTFNPENRALVAIQITTTSPRLPCENTTLHTVFFATPLKTHIGSRIEKYPQNKKSNPDQTYIKGVLTTSQRPRCVSERRSGAALEVHRPSPQQRSRVGQTQNKPLDKAEIARCTAQQLPLAECRP